MTKQVIQDPTRSYFKQMSEYLALNSLYAYKLDGFRPRSEVFSHVIATESSALTCFALGRMDIVSPLYEVFYMAVLEAAEAFSPVFHKDGTSRMKDAKEDTDIAAELESAYHEAIKKAGPVARKHLKDALEVTGIKLSEKEISDTLSTFAFNDLILLAGNAVKADVPSTLTLANKEPEEIRKSLSAMVKEDAPNYEKLEMLRLNAPGETIALPSMKLRFLEVAIRLGTATWKAGQIHRAVWENNIERIMPDKRDHVFDVDDQTRLNQYYTFAQAFSPEDALIRISFDFFKTLYSLQK